MRNWTAWDGTSEITAAADKVITVVECDADYEALGAGHATVVSAE